jgi:type I restriction enzyme S subunit
MSDGLRLGDHCDKIGSGATPRGGKEAYLSEGPYSLIRSQNVHNHGFEFSGLAYIDEEQARKLNNVAVREGDVLINITGDSVARACQVHPSVLPARVNQHVAIVRPRSTEIDPAFLRYWMVTPAVQAQLLGLASAGATRPALTKAMLEGLRVPAVPLRDQKGIATVLGSLDDKIEVNRQMNETLHAMAQAIFRDWFVEFGPTRRKIEGASDPAEIMGGLVTDAVAAQRLADMFPARLGDNGLPGGWEERPLQSVGNIVTGKTPSTKIAEFYGADVPFLKIPDMHGQMYVIQTQSMLSTVGALSQKKQTVPKSSVSVSCIATPGLVVLNHREVQTNQQINTVVPANTAWSPFLFWCCRKLSAEVMIGGSGGSVFHNMNKSTFSSLKVVWPQSETLINNFGMLVSLLHDRILANCGQNQTLAATRDLLLPKLMSGEIRLREAEERLEAAQ